MRGKSSNATKLLSQIKVIVDQSDQNGRYWITGSQQFSLMKGLQESLAGRVAILNILGLSCEEKNNKEADINSLFKEIFIGGFPIFQSNEAPNREHYFNSYVQTYLDRDLSDIFGVEKTSEFNKFLQVCAARTGQIINSADLARDSGVSVPTAIDWLGILESTMQIYLLRPYFSNITKRIIKAPKLYFLDTGLASYLTRWNTSETLQSGAMAGAMYETYIVAEFIKKYINQGKQPPIYYLRDKERHEVDLVIEDNGLHLVEIKLSANLDTEQTKNLNYYFNKSDNFKSKTIVSLVDKEIETSDKVKYIPYMSI